MMTFFGAVEVVYLKLKYNFSNSFIIVFLALFITSISVSVIGTMAIMNVQPFWKPQHFIPTLGMILGNSSTAVALTMQALMDALSDRPKIELVLAFGASKWEAGIIFSN